MVGLDARIVVIGLPQVAAALHADAAEAIWFTQSYILGTALTVLAIGRAGDMYGRLRIYNVGFVVFVVSSAVAAFCTDPIELIGVRFVQGIGTSAVITNSIAILTDATPRKELGLSLGINQVALKFGQMSGLTLSGILLAFFDWRAIFLAVVPFGTFGVIWSRMRLVEKAKIDKGAKIDWPGLVTFGVMIGSLMVALTLQSYGTVDALTTGLLLTSLVAASAFYFVERRSKSPLLDLRIFRVRMFTGGVLSLMLNTVSWGALLLILSLYLQLIVGYTPLEAGLRVIPADLTFLLTGPVSGKLSDRLGIRRFAVSGIILTSISLYLFSTVGIDTPYGVLVLIMTLFGVGNGLFTSPNASSIMRDVPAERRGVASGVRTTLSNVGFALSFNLTILLMSFVAPYSVLSHTISSGAVGVSLAEKRIFVEAIQYACLWFAAINAFAIIPSMVRGKRVADQDKSRSAGASVPSAVKP